MNEKIIEKLLGYMDSTGDFVLEQSPLLIQEICYVDFIRYIVSIIFIGIFLFGLVWSVYRLVCSINAIDEDNKTIKYENDKIDTFFPIVLVGILVTICVICFFAIGTEISKAIQVKYAPKYYIIEKVLNR